VADERIPRADRRAIALIGAFTAAGLVLRLAFGLMYWVNKPLTHDEREYLALARSLATDQGFRYPAVVPPELEPERFGRAPFYPFVLSRIAGQALLDPEPSSVPVSIKIAQSAVGAVGVPVLAALAWLAAGRQAGVVAALITAIHPPLVWISAYALSEVWYFVLAWVSALLLGLALNRRCPTSRATALVVASGAIGGVAALTRSAMIAFLALATLWLAVNRSIRLAAIFILAALLIVAPWTIRNFREHGRFVVIASDGGINFWIGNHPLARGEGDMAANPQIKLANVELRRRHHGMSPEALEPIYYQEAFSHVLRHPAWWVALLARKAYYLAVPTGPSYTLHSVRYRLGSVVPYLLLLPLAIAGARTLIRAGMPATTLWLMFAAAVLTSVLFFPQERFRIPVVDPTLIVCAAVWIAQRSTRADETRHHPG
jgi:hypothetical protein